MTQGFDTHLHRLQVTASLHRPLITNAFPDRETPSKRVSPTFSRSPFQYFFECGPKLGFSLAPALKFIPGLRSPNTTQLFNQFPKAPVFHSLQHHDVSPLL
jgi:hypothetical protein